MQRNLERGILEERSSEERISGKEKPGEIQGKNSGENPREKYRKKSYQEVFSDEGGFHK